MVVAAVAAAKAVAAKAVAVNKAFETKPAILFTSTWMAGNHAKRYM